MTNTGHKASSIWYAHSRRSPCLSWYRAPGQSLELFSTNTESQRTLSVRYFTSVSQQMLTAVKHVADDNFVFSRTAQWHIMQHSQTAGERTSFLLIMAFNLTAKQWSLLIIRFTGSHISTSISCKSTRIKEIKQRLVEVSRSRLRH